MNQSQKVGGVSAPSAGQGDLAHLPEQITLLTTADNKHVAMSRKSYALSGYLREQAEIGGSHSDEPVEIHGVTNDTLERIIQFCDKHQEHPIPLQEIEHPEPLDGSGSKGSRSGRTIPKPLKDASLENNGFPRWAVKFADELSLKEIFHILRVSHELAIHPLTLLLSAKVASFIKDMTPEEYKAHFSEGVSFSPEQEAQIREQNKWAEA